MGIIAIAGSKEKRNWALENCWYNIPLEKMADSPIMWEPERMENGETKPRVVA